MSRVVKMIVSRFGAGRTLACAAVVLGFGFWAAQASAYVYWSNFSRSSSIGRANLDGTGASDNYITGAGSGEAGVAVNGQYIYWANANGSGDSIGRANLNGMSAPDQAFITGAHAPQGVAVNGQHIYWANFSTDSIGRANLDGTDAHQRFITGANRPYGLAVNGQYIYWTNLRGGTIERANLNGTGTPDQTFITGAHEPRGVAVNGQYIYWANAAGTSIGRANLNGTSTPDQRFITGAHAPFGVVVAGQYIYWTNLRAATIERANLNGTGTPDQRFITRLPLRNGWLAVATRVPPWTLELTAVPAIATIGTPLTITATTNNILGGTPHYHINISAGGRLVKRCRVDTCTMVSGSPALGSTAYAADVGPAHTKPFSKKAVVSAETTVDRTRPTCTGTKCM